MPAGNNAEFGLGGRGSANKDPSSQTDKISSFKTMTPPLKPTIPPLKTMTPPPKPTIPPPKPMTPPPKPSSPPPKPMTPPPPSPRKLTLYTNHLTPNGLKASIYLEELCALKELSFQYEIKRVDLSKGSHKEPWFIKMNPNGRIPVLVDHSADDFPVFESAAILLYLEQNCDTKKAFSFDAQKDPKEYSSMIQWIFFAHGGLGPMQGQAHYFLHYCSEEIPFAQARYLEETKRLYGVLEIGLNNRDWLVGTGRGRYTIADMNALPWVRLHTRAGIENLDAWPNLKDWLARISDQPGVKAAIQSMSL